MSDSILIEPDCRYISRKGLSRVPNVAPCGVFGTKLPPNTVCPVIPRDPVILALPVYGNNVRLTLSGAIICPALPITTLPVVGSAKVNCTELDVGVLIIAGIITLSSLS